MKVTCPSCQQAYSIPRVPANLTRFKCKKCGAAVPLTQPDPKAFYCTSCGHIGRPRKETPGSFLIELVLWLCFFVPGIIYTLWRHSARHRVCELCGARAVIPAGSPLAQRA